jgi:hypothetical protein
MSTAPKFTATVINPNSTNDEGDPEGVNLNNFFSLMNKSGTSYIFIPCRDLWPAKSVNARLPPMPVLNNNGNPRRGPDGKIIYQSASRWLDQNRPIEAMTWAPGLPLQISDRLISMGGWIERKGVSCFNFYRPPRIKLGDASKAKFWTDHVYRIYPNDADHIIKWLAHRVQRPGDKINHALVLGGEQGIGKDSMLEPVKEAVGRWNFQEIKPKDLLGRFNPFAKSVILRINEARDLGDIDRFKFYDLTKVYTAAPPDVLRVDEKNIPEHYVPNVLGFILTTNHKTDGIYLPAGDRRHYVAWSDRAETDFSPAYWNTLWRYYTDGGFGHVAAYLTEFDLSSFDPKAPPPKTPTFWEIVNVNVPPEDAELADVIDSLGEPDPNNPKVKLPPDAVTVPELIAAATDEIGEWLMNRGNRRSLPHRLERCGYTAVPNPDRRDKLWKCSNARVAVYVRANFSHEERTAAARKKAQS